MEYAKSGSFNYCMDFYQVCIVYQAVVKNNDSSFLPSNCLGGEIKMPSNK